MDSVGMDRLFVKPILLLEPILLLNRY